MKKAALLTAVLILIALFWAVPAFPGTIPSSIVPEGARWIAHLDMEKFVATKLFEYSYYGLAVIANRSAYVERVKVRDSLANVSFIEEISSEAIARECLSVAGVARARRGEWRSVVLWQLQQPVIESMYQDVEQLSRK